MYYQIISLGRHINVLDLIQKPSFSVHIGAHKNVSREEYDILA